MCIIISIVGCVSGIVIIDLKCLRALLVDCNFERMLLKKEREKIIDKLKKVTNFLFVNIF